MQSLKLNKDIHWVGSLDPDLRVFDIIMHTEFGTSYNSYIVKGSEKTALIETVKIKFFDAFLEKIKEVTPIESIDYIIVDHTEPDHVGSIEKLLTLAPHAKIVGSATAITFLKEITNKNFESIIVNPKETLTLGNKTLRFINAPFLHWPDSIYTYVEEDHTLFTCDSFGAHYSFDPILNEKITKKVDYHKALKYYYDMIMGPFKSYVLKALDQIKNLKIDMICPGHGPVLNHEPEKIIELYKEWSTENTPNSKKTIVIPYVSAYGYTEEIAKKITEGIKQAGDINVLLYDMVYADPNEVLSEIYWADGLLFGSPTINGDALKPIWDLLTSLSPIVHGGKIVSAFGSYGWSGEGVPNIVGRLKTLRMKVFEKGLKIRFKPSENNLKDALSFGINFGVSVLKGEVPKVIEEKEKYTLVSDDGEVKVWKCVVCGELFEGVEPPDTCPACGVGKDYFVEVKKEIIAFQSQNNEKIIIIGNNAAGVSAAEAIRERNKVCSVEIISNENIPGYYRPSISKSIVQEIQDHEFYLKSMDWYKENNIQLTLHTEVIDIKKDTKTILLSNGEEKSYDKLIIATGSHCFMPPIEGNEKKGVFTLRSFDDANRIKEYAKSSKRAVVVGGGILGLEIAWELKNLGLNLTIIELAPRLLPRQLDEKGSSILEEAIAKQDIKVIKNTLAGSLLGDEKVTAVKTKDGEIIECDMVIVSAGIRANKKLAEKAGIITNKGIVVDQAMKTNEENIFAAGDVAEFDGIDYGIWPEAIEQGKIAGANAVGDPLYYENIIPSNVFNGMNVNIFSIGDLGRNSEKAYETIEIHNRDQGLYHKMYFVNNVFVGGILIGDTTKSVKMMEGIDKRSSLSTMIKIMNH
ncbi:FAD-dependent oxidoreductase [Crassaminicella profunda]|uniref:FAD-dependent oxidoreductase n=1 Tax=Crassaminicella profunda TaxID=1286698 RepID=UPI001CA60CB5|nr:FAD-dependent oxidoreductase [Crassaminicella profunda]QZY54692.1 FAD-dependent oxidoreductase [Crassaminicella profunda]